MEYAVILKEKRESIATFREDSFTLAINQLDVICPLS